MSKPKQLYWIGDRDANGNPLEFFGAVPGLMEAIPAADLDEAWLADATEAQWEALESPTGRRLYRHTDPSKSDSAETRAQAKAADAGANRDQSNTDAPSADGSS